MRLNCLPALLLASTLLVGCSSTSDPTAALSVKTSNETTASIAPTPPAKVSGGEEMHELAWAGGSAQSPALSAVSASGYAAPTDRPNTVMAPVVKGGRLKVYAQQFRDAKPINFGKVQPKHYAVHGVDVSRWQGDIDWPKLRTQGANFAYIKATDGGDHIDPMFAKNWREAKEAGLKRGAYHFFYWCRVASQQAEWFIKNVPNDPDALPPVIDVEYNHQSDCRFKISAEKAREKMQVFMDMLERHYGKRPVIYTAPDFYADNLAGHFKTYPFWLRAVAQHPSKVYPNRDWVFWQYSGSGLSHGVSEKIDLNVFRGTVEQWHDFAEGGRRVASR
ncbi:GH25 family lysozyme [Ciceribacter sp. L1K22]|uniref:glycoside hydrolase family 25 protein n=1 Tax=Ciceribacter sp. L1K22 TaxID=2820275 RepID=UPI001ABE0114|nr:GH25 family lysozyme [Ciceribacter sp. L1K22]MBO3759425.1 glycoside hydrolase family 25 protein [Ciceribacter sp. L1K22]